MVSFLNLPRPDSAIPRVHFGGAIRRFRRYFLGASLFAFLLALMGLGACGGGSSNSSSKAPASDSYADQFDFLWQTYDQQYAFFDYKQIDWSALHDTYRPQAIAATSEDQFVQVIVAMLANLHDVHTWLVSPSGVNTTTYTPTAFVNYDESVWQQYMSTLGTNVAEGTGYYSSAQLSGVAYIAIPQWYSQDSSQIAALDSALQQFQNAPSIITDMRMNTGGDNETALEFAERFADRTRTVGYDQYRDGPAHNDFGPLIVRQVSPGGPWQFKGQVQLLIGRDCFSATEDFITDMRELPNVTVIGDTSGGGDSIPVLYPLAGGWKFTVPSTINYTAEMQIIQDRGIDPAVFVPASMSDFATGKDPVLDYAIHRLSQ